MSTTVTMTLDEVREYKPSPEELEQFNKTQTTDFSDCPKLTKEELEQFKPWYDLHPDWYDVTVRVKKADVHLKIDVDVLEALKTSNKAFPLLTAFMRLLLLQNQLNNESHVHFIDSTPVSTCLNRRIFSHKVTKDFASRGKSTKGWFYGFKLHGVCSEKGVLEAVAFTSGNIHDSKMVGQVTKNLKGSFFCDAGYLKNSKELVELANSGRFIYAATRQNMNRLMTVNNGSI